MCARPARIALLGAHQDRKRRVRAALERGGPVSEDDRAWFLKADRVGIRQVFMPDILPATLVALFVACCSTCIFGTVGAWMPLYLTTEKGWSTAEYSGFYVAWGIVASSACGSPAGSPTARPAAGFIVLLLEGRCSSPPGSTPRAACCCGSTAWRWSFGFLGFWGPSTVLTAEIFPTRIRGVANGVVWAIAYFVGFVLWPFATVACSRRPAPQARLPLIPVFMLLMAAASGSGCPSMPARS